MLLPLISGYCNIGFIRDFSEKIIPALLKNLGLKLEEKALGYQRGNSLKDRVLVGNCQYQTEHLQ